MNPWACCRIKGAWKQLDLVGQFVLTFIYSFTQYLRLLSICYYVRIFAIQVRLCLIHICAFFLSCLIINLYIFFAHLIPNLIAVGFNCNLPKIINKTSSKLFIPFCPLPLPKTLSPAALRSNFCLAACCCQPSPIPIPQQRVQPHRLSTVIKSLVLYRPSLTAGIAALRWH